MTVSFFAWPPFSKGRGTVTLFRRIDETKLPGMQKKLSKHYCRLAACKIAHAAWRGVGSRNGIAKIVPKPEDGAKTPLSRYNAYRRLS